MQLKGFNDDGKLLRGTSENDLQPFMTAQDYL